MSKKHKLLLLSLFTGLSMYAQRNYLAFDYSFSGFKHAKASASSAGISERLNRCEINYAGVSFHAAFRQRNSIGIGMGLSKINYQKEWLGTFPESNQFGAATVNGMINYWSFPISYIRRGGYGPGRLGRSYKHYNHYRSASDRSWFQFGFSITYTPSFAGQTAFSANTSGGADLNTFLSGFQSNEQSFQHSLTVGLCDQLLLLNKGLRLDLEPYAGIGSGYFKASGTSINNFSFGLRVRIGISPKLPTISIEKESDKGNAEEKKKLLEKKQKEIEEQLNKKP